jgi:hypothetical protein
VCHPANRNKPDAVPTVHCQNNESSWARTNQSVKTTYSLIDKTFGVSRISSTTRKFTRSGTSERHPDEAAFSSKLFAVNICGRAGKASNSASMTHWRTGP